MDGISVLTFKNMPILPISDLEAKNALFDFLELISSRDDIKVLVIKGAPVKMGRFDIKELIRYLEFEDALLRKLVRSYQ